MDRKIPFTLDTREKKILGVCSGLGRTAGIDPTFIRVAWIAVPLLTFVTVWQAIVAYLICGIIGTVQRNRVKRRDERSEFERMEDAGGTRHSVHDLRTKLDSTDRRMMAVDHHLNSHNDELAREIEATADGHPLRKRSSDITFVAKRIGLPDTDVEKVAAPDLTLALGTVFVGFVAEAPTSECQHHHALPRRSALTSVVHCQSSRSKRRP